MKLEIASNASTSTFSANFYLRFAARRLPFVSRTSLRSFRLEQTGEKINHPVIALEVSN